MGAVEVRSSMILYLFLSGGPLEAECKYKRRNCSANITNAPLIATPYIGLKIFFLWLFLFILFCVNDLYSLKKKRPRV